ncbi:MAG: DNA-3-methyladenine glycosylase 2 family protein [Ignavibacteria bacterium]|nr:DNA-3-methyladenine glycosylase 2 family protein [Ignavibacteria bacterium]
MKNDICTKAVKHLSSHDSIISTLIKKFGKCNLQPHREYFNSLLRAIIGQQLSVKAASSIYLRLAEFFNHKPTPQDLFNIDVSILRSFGLSNAKTVYVKDLAEKILNNEIRLKNFNKRTDEEILSELTKVKGIGIWTAQMFLAFTLGRADVLPYSDLGIRKSIMLNYGLRKLPDEKKIKKIAKDNNWHPYCTIASMYLWKSLDNKFETIME